MVTWSQLWSSHARGACRQIRDNENIVQPRISAVCRSEQKAGSPFPARDPYAVFCQQPLVSEGRISLRTLASVVIPPSSGRRH